MFIDIHNHTLFGVDDGSPDIKESEKILAEAKKQGAEAIILTPHYRRGMFVYPTKEIEENFIKLKIIGKKLGIELLLGCEYHVNGSLIEYIQSGRCKTLAGSDYILTEYSYQTEYSYMLEQTQKLLSNGYFSVIAHVERYQCFQKKPKLCAEISNMGAMIQINADSVLGLEGFKVKQFCKKLLQKEWVDIIASDTHGLTERANHMGHCKEYVEKKYGTEYAEVLFINNPRRILENM